MSELPTHTENPTAATENDGSKEQQSRLEKRRSITNIVSVVVMSFSIAVIVLELFTILEFYTRDDQDHIGIMYAATITGIILAPTVMMKQYILQQLDSLRCVHNKIRMEVNRMTEENNILHRNVDALEVEVVRVQDAEQKLSSIMEGSNENVEKLLKAVQENKQTVKRQGELARAAFQEQLLTTVLRTDRNQDLKITDREVDILVIRMRKQEGITLDEETFRRKIQDSQGSIWGIMELLREVGNRSDDDDDDEGRTRKKLVQVDEKSLIDSQRGLVQKEANSSLATACDPIACVS